MCPFWRPLNSLDAQKLLVKEMHRMSGLVVLITILALQQLPYLPMSGFTIDTNCSGGISPHLVDAYTVYLPVEPFIPGCTAVPIVAEAISKTAYKLSKFSFIGTFKGAAVALNSFDEEDVFVADNIIGWDGQEFGFRLSLLDNVLYGYVQDGANTVTQKKPFFYSLMLMTNDGEQHVFTAQFKTTHTFKNYFTNIFTWLVDGQTKGSFSYTWSTNFASFKFYPVATTHRQESGWTSTGLYLVAGDVEVTYTQ